MSHKFCLLRLRQCDIWPFFEEKSVFMTFGTLTFMLFDKDDRTPEIILNVFQTFLFFMVTITHVRIGMFALLNSTCGLGCKNPSLNP